MEIQIGKRYPVLLGDPGIYRIVLVGCGGTGSFLALHLARLVYHARAIRKIQLTFVDPDTVEEKNIGRQNFAPAEVGQPKATTLAVRYSLAFGLSIKYLAQPCAQLHMYTSPDNATIIVGAVDNAPARQSILSAAGNLGAWWLDCGNNLQSGQVLLGNSNTSCPVISPLGFCSHLPMPSVLHPELLDIIDPDENGLSCADLVQQDAQSLMINQAMAAWAAQYLYRLVVTQDLDIYATYLDLDSGSARSLPIVDHA